MSKLFTRITSLSWLDYLLILFFIVFFKEAIFYIWSTFQSKEFYENGMAFVVITAVLIYSLWRQRSQTNNAKVGYTQPLILILSILGLSVLNAFFLKLGILPAALFLLGVYSLLGFYFEKNIWRRTLFIFIILIMTLPFLERVQRFLGFPIRLVTANIVSTIFHLLGIGHASQSTIIITENRATSIDLPCSGVKSIYTGGLFMLATYYLQNIKLSIKLVILSVTFFILLIFFNIWRVFSLVYVYDILNLQQAGDNIHLIMGVTGFLISCVFIWYGASKYLPKISFNKSLPVKEKYQGIYIKIIVILILLVSLVAVHFSSNPQKTIPSKALNQEKNLVLNNTKLENLSFNEREQSFFINSDVDFSKKYKGETKEGLPFTLLLVSSKSARTHHDPETCLLGLGYKINNSEIFRINDITVRRLSLNENNAHLIYWFLSSDKIIIDYSERVWEQIKNPNKEWVLIEVGFAQSVDMEDKNISDLLFQINSAAKTLLLSN